MKSAFTIGDLKERIAIGLISVLGNSANPALVQKINDWASEYTDPAELAEDAIKIFEEKEHIKDLYKDVKETITK
ncbi:MAG: hypothetical protein KGM16_00715 [Bacteroidota bacterium]|nr:hypothetical protein [Bacteroidota bacterium]